MTQQELEEQRLQHWSDCAARASLTGEGVRQYVGELGYVGFATIADLPLPTLAALAGGDERSLKDLHQLVQEETKAGAVVELRIWKQGFVYVTPELAAFVLASIGGLNFSRAFRTEANRRKLSFLAAEVYEALMDAPGPVTVSQLRAKLGSGGTADLAVERALNQLAPRMNAIHVGESDGEPAWAPLSRHLPQVVKQALDVSQLQAAAALLTKRLGCVLVETEEAMGDFFVPLVPRHRLRSALMGLEAGREISIDSVDGRPAYRLFVEHATKL